MAGSAIQFLRLPVLASSGLAVVASGLLYFKQKYALLACSANKEYADKRLVVN
jgi:hypothetical protein